MAKINLDDAGIPALDERTDAKVSAAKTLEEQAARIAVLRAALEIATGYMFDYIGEQRVRYEGYKPTRHACWVKDEAQVKAALKGGK